MNLTTEYHLHGKEKTWLKARTIDQFGVAPSGEALFYLQELSTGEGRVCFNSQLARQLGINFKDLQDGFKNSATEDNKKYTSMRFKTTPSKFKDSKDNNMIFEDALRETLSTRFWTYSSDLKDGKVVDIAAAPFVNKDTAKGLFNLIRNNFVPVINNFENNFKDVNNLSVLNIGITSINSSLSLKDKIKHIKGQNSLEPMVQNNIRPKI